MMPKGVLERKNDVNVMKSPQKHTHSDYCCRNKSCCFGFPKPPASKTVISQEPSEEDKLMTSSSMQKMYFKRYRIFYHLVK